MRVVFGLLALVATVIVEARINYLGQEVLRCHYSNSSVISELEDTLDVWAVLINNTIDVRTKTASEKQLVLSTLTDCEVIIPDVEEYIQKGEGLRLVAAYAKNADWFDSYHNYSETVAWYKTLASSNPTLVTYQSAGTSYEGRDMPAVRFHGGSSKAKYAVYFQCQIHAREWISGATCSYIANQLVTDYKAGVSQVVTLLQNLELVLVPFVNPDGYVYTWTTDRLWRKNRNRNGNACYGTDINRNYPDHWNGGGSSTNPCSDTYMGPSAGSEPETKNTVNYFLALQKTAPVVAFIDWHSYSQLVLRPYGWTSANSPDEAVLSQVGATYAANVKSVHGRTYTSQKSIDLYVTSGTASDWGYGTQATTGNQGKRAGSYTVELRPAGSPPGFELPPAEIVPTGQENYAAVKNFLTYFLNNPLSS
jgi:murein tripeptide amidase MpaA